mgnify:CR=1 FL=1
MVINVQKNAKREYRILPTFGVKQKVTNDQ